MNIPDHTLKSGGLDSSTAIVLYKSGILKLLLDEWDVKTTQFVTEEIGAGEGSEEILKELGACVVRDSSCEGPFGRGENSILGLYKHGRIQAVFSDDGKFLDYCQRNRIPHYSSIVVPYLLYKNKALSHAQACEYMRIITEQGRFADWVIQYAEELMG
jgi:hypothetical protein